MREFEIWEEGYAITGNEARASFVGREVGESFLDACKTWFKKHPVKDYDPERNAVWGCRLYDNEADARKSFG